MNLHLLLLIAVSLVLSVINPVVLLGQSSDNWPLRRGPLGNIYASPVAASGRVYVTDLDGVTLVLTHSGIPRVIAVNRLGENVSASAAVVGREIFLRGDKHLFCLANRE